MRRLSFTQDADHVLLRDTRALLGQDSATTGELIARLAEIDARQLYRPAGYSSMFGFCVDSLHLSEDAAGKRINAARVARKFPVLFAAVADGRLHLSAVLMLAPHLSHENVEELVAAATHRSKREIERLLAERFPSADVPTRLEPIGPVILGQAPEHGGAASLGLANGSSASASLDASQDEHAPERVHVTDPSQVPASAEHAPEHVPASDASPSQPPAPPTTRPRMKPLSPGRFALQVTISEETHDMLRYAEALLSHALPAGDLEAVLKRVLEAAIPALEKRRFAAAERSPRGRRRASTDPRHIPKPVKATVWRRDGGRCTFVSDDGHRCDERRWIEFDHVPTVARGGKPTVEEIRLRCSAHNQLEAERVFGAGFMKEKREAARQRAKASRRARSVGRGTERHHAATPESVSGVAHCRTSSA